MMLWTAPPPARECQGCGAVKAPTVQRSYSCHLRSSIASPVHSPFMKLPFRLPLGAPGLWPHKEVTCRDTASDAIT